MLYLCPLCAPFAYLCHLLIPTLSSTHTLLSLATLTCSLIRYLRCLLHSRYCFLVFSNLIGYLF